MVACIVGVAVLDVGVVLDANAQSNTISVKGRVTDQNGEPIMGAAVVVVGTTTGTVTDFDGNYELRVASDATIQSAFIGYTQVQEAVNGRTTINFTLVDEFAELEEVQVVAYGAQKKVTVTGAISSVKSEDLVRTPISSVTNVLAGQLSGVSTVQFSGEPGSDAATIYVRGKASFSDDDDATSPLIQVDGVERDMYDLDPNEIESITVLKDASATAVFGVRGANGVILVTTKRGSEGKSQISVTTSYSALAPTKMVEMASSYDYATFYNQMRENDGSAAVFSDAVIEKFKDGSDPVRFPSVDWADYIMKDYTMQTQHNINISGGNDKVKYFVSGGFFTQGGLFKQFGLDYDLDYRYKRFNYRSNIDINVTKSTQLSISASGKMDRTNKPMTGQGSSGMIKNIYYATPFSSPGFVDGKLVINGTSTADNPDGLVLPFTGGHGLAYLLTGGYYKQDNNKVSIDLGLNQNLDFWLKGLSFRIKGAYNTSYYVQKTASGASVATYTPVASVDDDGNVTLQYRKSGEDLNPTSYSNTLGKGRDWYFETAFSYNNTFNQTHTVTGLVLYNQSKEYYPSTYSDIARAYVGLVGRVTYDYKNRYMAEVNFGYNGSENFAKGNRFGSFPAGSVGWNISEENFMYGLRPWISFMKIRASWGLVGSDKIGGTRFMYTPDSYTVNDTSVKDHNGSAYLYGENTTYSTAETTGIVYGTQPSQSMLNNADVSWEKAFKQDYGVDINFLDNRLTTTFDYYYEKRKDILAQDATAPGILGFDQPYTNFGRVNSWGWELSVGWNSMIGDEFRIWAKANLSYNQNEIIEDRQAPQDNEYQYTAGRRIGSRSQYKFWRLYDSDADALYQAEFGASLPEQSLLASGISDGDAIYVDLDGNGVVNELDMSRDYGYTDDPEYIVGLNVGFNWKHFTFNMQWSGAWHVSRMISDVFRVPFQSASGYTEGGLLQYHVDYTWSEDNPSQSAKYPRATFSHHDQNYATSTLYEQDSKYLRLKTAELAYDFDFDWMKTVGIKKMQFSVSGYNLLTFTPYKWGDPETRASNAPSYPLQRTYTGTLKLNF